MTTNEQVFDLLQRSQLNWSVNKEALFTSDGKGTKSYGLFKSSNDAWLGTVGNGYTPMQNATLAHIIVEAAQGVGQSFDRGGQLQGGKRVYLQAELPDEYIGRSTLKRYITALNSHDGTTSIAFGATNQVVICENTFHMAYTSGDLTRFRHSLTAENRIKAAMEQMRSALMGEAQVIANFKKMAAQPLNEEISRGIVMRILKDGFDVKPDDKLSTRRENQLKALDVSITKELIDEGNTLWGLFNGVTRYTNHVAAPKDDKLAYVMVGAGEKLNGVAYETIMEWLDQHTDEEMLVEKV